MIPQLSQVHPVTPLVGVVSVSKVLLRVVCFSLFAIEGGRQGAADLLLQTPFFILPACLLDSAASSLLLLWIPVYLANLYSATNRGSRYQSYCEKPRVFLIRRVMVAIILLELIPLLPLDHAGWPWRLASLPARFLWIPFVALHAHPTPRKGKVIKETNATRRISEFYTYLAGLCTAAHLLAVARLLWSVSRELLALDITGAVLRAVGEGRESTLVGVALRCGLAEVAAATLGLVLLQVGEDYQKEVPLFLALCPFVSPAGAFCFFLIRRETDIRGPVKIRKSVPGEAGPSPQRHRQYQYQPQQQRPPPASPGSPEWQPRTIVFTE